MKNFGKYFLLLITLALFGCGAKDSNTEKEIPSQVRKEVASKSIQPSAAKKVRKNKPEKEIPQKVLIVLQHIRLHDKAPEGYVGGKRFGNFERLLPIKGENDKKLAFKEWDVNPRRHRQNRGGERLITSNDNRAWYTSDHYRSFVEIR